MTEPCSNGGGKEISSTRKRSRPAEESKNSLKSYTIEWPMHETAGDMAHGGNHALTARVTFAKQIPGSHEKLCVMGRAQIQCLEGSIVILGHRLFPGHDMLQIESPPWSSLLVLEPDFTATEKTSVVVQVESCWPQDAENHLEATFELVSSVAPGVRPTYILPTWEKTVDLVLPDAVKTATTDSNEKPKSRRPSFRMAICGAKGVGKSTFLRYATNRILSGETKQVAILDADVGQPEMSPPGMLTLTIVSDPLLTPPHYRSMAVSSGASANQRQFSYYVGCVTSKIDPNKYLQVLRRLIQHFEEDILREDEGNVPLLINLDGWVKGLGFELLSTILTEILNPSHVIQIVGTTKSKQFQLSDVINPETSSANLHVIHSYNSSLNFSTSAVPTEIEKAGGNGDTEINNGVNEIGASGHKVPSSCVMPAQALRALRLCTYFLNDVTIWYNLGFNHEGIRDDTCEIAHRLASAPPYAVPFEAVEIRWEGSDHFSDMGTNFDLILDNLNASIVGLSCRDCSTNKSRHGTDLLPCVGLGLVRAIDRMRGIYYVLTPVNPEKLKAVNVLVGGTMEVPNEFWFRGVHAELFRINVRAAEFTCRSGRYEESKQHQSQGTNKWI